MIETLDPNDSQDNRSIYLIAKINELIRGYNELHEKLDPLVAIINNETGVVTWRLRVETAS